MMHNTLARAAAGAALTVALCLVSAPAAQAAPGAARHGANLLTGPLSLDNLLSLRFLTPTVLDAKRQVTGLVSGMDPAQAAHPGASGLGGLIK
ncbi:hypothetical protein LG634_34680 [Streptomyces bambusae]|uniref:hypothetical protein n=1 Tax=Streptomyces bambusae TaxID=1550616 RepID=UPI001CFF9857|nr:hypothetical protein [Streptomyces bambusae]MCB5169935.1 hypothetical protein [Streptomyces bambusae]